MAKYIYCQRPSDSARELLQALDLERLRRFDGFDFWRRNRRVHVNSGDSMICWGNSFPVKLNGVKILNGARVGNKKDSAHVLACAGIPTITVYDSIQFRQHPGPGYLARTANHFGGNDLLHPPENPDFYVLKQEFVREFRVHSFDGLSIRAGEKVPREGFAALPPYIYDYFWGKVAAGSPAEAAAKVWLASPEAKGNFYHPWIRTYDAGWKVKYDGFRSKSIKGLRDIAHKAVAALGLTFGAVDIGQQADGTLVVFEVNRAPGLEGNSINKYVSAITEWFDEGPRKKDVKDEAEENE